MHTTRGWRTTPLLHVYSFMDPERTNVFSLSPGRQAGQAGQAYIQILVVWRSAGGYPYLFQGFSMPLWFQVTQSALSISFTVAPPLFILLFLSPSQCTTVCVLSLSVPPPPPPPAACDPLLLPGHNTTIHSCNQAIPTSV